MNDPVLERLIGLQQQMDAFLTRLDELECLFKRYCELTRTIETGVPPSPPPPVN
jgi:hypothetical protein